MKRIIILIALLLLMASVGSAQMNKLYYVEKSGQTIADYAAAASDYCDTTNVVIINVVANRCNRIAMGATCVQPLDSITVYNYSWSVDSITWTALAETDTTAKDLNGVTASIVYPLDSIAKYIRMECVLTDDNDGTNDTGSVYIDWNAVMWFDD